MEVYILRQVGAWTAALDELLDFANRHDLVIDRIDKRAKVAYLRPSILDDKREVAEYASVEFTLNKVKANIEFDLNNGWKL